MSKLDSILFGLNALGTVVFAITGVIAGKRRRIDLFGAVLLGVITAIGGGTVRDLLLGRTPVFWIYDNTALIIAMVASFLGFFMVAQLEKFTKILAYLDAIGLAVFAVVGAQIAESAGANPLIIILMGCVTGCFGGLIRDLLTDRVPFLLSKDIYATATLVGGFFYVVLANLPLENPIRLIVASVIIAVIRIFSMNKGLSLPKL